MIYNGGMNYKILTVFLYPPIFTGRNKLKVLALENAENEEIFFSKFAGHCFADINR